MSNPFLEFFSPASLRRVERGLDDIRTQLKRMEKSMSASLDRLKEEVAENNTLIGSVTTLLSELSERIRENAEDPVALNALANDLDAQNAALAAAVEANTPTAPAPPVPPEEPPVEPL